MNRTYLLLLPLLGAFGCAPTKVDPYKLPADYGQRDMRPSALVPDGPAQRPVTTMTGVRVEY